MLERAVFCCRLPGVFHQNLIVVLFSKDHQTGHPDESKEILVPMFSFRPWTGHDTSRSLSGRISPKRSLSSLRPSSPPPSRVLLGCSGGVCQPKSDEKLDLNLHIDHLGLNWTFSHMFLHHLNPSLWSFVFLLISKWPYANILNQHGEQGQHGRIVTLGVFTCWF